MPRLTRTGVGFAFTLLAIPIGSALIGAGLSLLGSKDASATLGAVLLPVGIIIALAPAIYYGGVRIWRIIRRGWRSEEDGGLSELPALVTGQASTESRTLVTQTADPTSVEFESIFRDLLDEALEPENRKLLIVVDNLDRVEPSDALSIWSTLQTFLGHTDYQRPDWIDRLWVLIPYDHNAILRLWDGSGSNATKPANSSLATSFLDKTFQLRFRVPPLLLSNWREFLQQALQQALPNHQEADFHGVYRAFAANGGLEDASRIVSALKMKADANGQPPPPELEISDLYKSELPKLQEQLIDHAPNDAKDTLLGPEVQAQLGMAISRMIEEVSKGSGFHFNMSVKDTTRTWLGTKDKQLGLSITSEGMIESHKKQLMEAISEPDEHTDEQGTTSR